MLSKSLGAGDALARCPWLAVQRRELCRGDERAASAPQDRPLVRDESVPSAEDAACDTGCIEWKTGHINSSRLLVMSLETRCLSKQIAEHLFSNTAQSRVPRDVCSKAPSWRAARGKAAVGPKRHSRSKHQARSLRSRPH